jgi:hypothetical protein
MLATSYLLLLATDTHPGGQKIRIVSVRVRLGAQPAAVLVGGGRLELARAIPGPGAERLSSGADVVSGRIEHQHHQVNHIVAGQSFCAVHPRHQKLIGGGNDTERKHVDFA